jgi:uncharacterized membrane protein ArfC
MPELNWWLMVLAFLLGLLLTFAMMIRRVTREVPVTKVAGAAPLKSTVEKVEKADRADRADRILEKEPYGAGSIRVSARAQAPTGYTIKGDKDTGRYFTVDSPEYAVTEAEVWFADEDSAAKAGFLHWDAQGDQRG